MVGQLDPDEGDISLAFGARNSSANHSQQKAGSSSVNEDVSGFTSQRLLTKAMFERGSSSVSSEGHLSTGSAQSKNGLESLSLDDNDNESSSESGPSTPRWRADQQNLEPRPASVQPPRNIKTLDYIPFPVKAPTTRRISSSLGRSRSLNVRMPSVDLSTQTFDKGKETPMSATNSRLTPTSKTGWSKRPGEPRPPPLMSNDIAQRMSRWVKEIVVCNFDLERGPIVERRARGRRWGPGEKENVAFSSFPDTSLFAEGTILFSFKIRQIPPDPSTLSQPEPPSPMPNCTEGKGVENRSLDMSVQEHGNEFTAGTEDRNMSKSPAGISTGQKAEEYRKWDERGREWLYGFVWFEQRRDRGISRGYMQKSLVILTHLPFPGLFAAVLQKMAPVFFEHGYSALEAACHSMASWPDPAPDCLLQLPFMSDVLLVELPDTTESPQIDKTLHLCPSPDRPILASLPPSSPLRTLAPVLTSLWSLWECLLLSEPLLIIAPDPRISSELVWWLRDLIRPFPPSGDLRPYLHIHDHDFSLLVNKAKPQPGVVVGVTNPFFRNAASHWPNVVSIPSLKGKKGISGVQEPEGFISRRVRSIQKDHRLLKRLENLVAEGNLDDPDGNEALRRHFQQLTEKFLVPLNRYFQTLIPTPSPTMGPNPPTFPLLPLTPRSFSHLSPSPSLQTSHLCIRPFSLPTFLSHLRFSGPNPLAFRTRGLTGKVRVESDFYASFCMSSGFAGWLSSRVESLEDVLSAPIPSETPASSLKNVSTDKLQVPISNNTPLRNGHGKSGTE
ncbi:hypothetical protein L204_100125 [Cryptococcus depauperatus]